MHSSTKSQYSSSLLRTCEPPLPSLIVIESKLLLPPFSHADASTPPVTCRQRHFALRHANRLLRARRGRRRSTASYRNLAAAVDFTGTGVVETLGFLYYIFSSLISNYSVKSRAEYSAISMMFTALAIESPPSHIIVLGFLNGALNSLKRDISRMFAIFYGRPNIDAVARSNEDADSFPSAIKSLMTTVGDNFELRSLDCISEKHNFDGEGDPRAVFNVLDALLKDSLDRLKAMRESISLAKSGLRKCIVEAVQPDYTVMIRDLCLKGKLGAALLLRRRLIIEGFFVDLLTHNYLLNGLCINCDMEMADSLFREMLEKGPSPNCATYNIIIKGFCLHRNMDKALDLFYTMANSGIRPSRITYNILLHALCKRGLLEDARKLLEDILDDDIKTTNDAITSTILMDGCFKSGDMIQAIALWDEMVEKKTKVDVVAYNVLIHGLCLNQDKKIALGYVVDMLKRGFFPDIFTYNTLISDLCKEGQFGEAYYIHNVMSRMGVSPNQISYKMIIQGLCINGDAIKANEFLHSMLEKSMVPEPHIWNLIIDCYGRYGHLSNAISIRDQMLAIGVLPNVFTFNALIHAQVKRGNIFNAYSLKKDMLLLGLFPDVVTYNLLISGACKCGQIHFALQLYDEMLRKGYEPDKITYTELIRGRCMCGDMKEAEDLFIKLHKSGLPMDIVPFKVIFEKYHRIGEPDMAFKFYQRWLTMMA